MQTEEARMTLGEVLRRYRNAAGISQENMGHIVGITGNAYAAWENGQAQPKVMALLKAWRHLNIPLDVLIGLGEEGDSTTRVLLSSILQLPDAEAFDQPPLIDGLMAAL